MTMRRMTNIPSFNSKRNPPMRPGPVLSQQEMQLIDQLEIEVANREEKIARINEGARRRQRSNAAKNRIVEAIQNDMQNLDNMIQAEKNRKQQEELELNQFITEQNNQLQRQKTELKRLTEIINSLRNNKENLEKALGEAKSGNIDMAQNLRDQVMEPPGMPQQQQDMPQQQQGMFQQQQQGMGQAKRMQQAIGVMENYMGEYRFTI